MVVIEKKLKTFTLLLPVLFRQFVLKRRRLSWKEERSSLFTGRPVPPPTAELPLDQVVNFSINKILNSIVLPLHFPLPRPPGIMYLMQMGKLNRSEIWNMMETHFCCSFPPDFWRKKNNYKWQSSSFWSIILNCQALRCSSVLERYGGCSNDRRRK